MAEQQHPITPPLELVRQWRDKWLDDECTDFSMLIATQAARWGADQQLRAVCMWLAQETPLPYVEALRAAMRPKPPSSAEQALDRCNDYIDPDGIIRAALERLQQFEQESNGN